MLKDSKLKIVFDSSNVEFNVNKKIFCRHDMPKVRKIANIIFATVGCCTKENMKFNILDKEKGANQKFFYLVYPASNWYSF